LQPLHARVGLLPDGRQLRLGRPRLGQLAQHEVEVLAQRRAAEQVDVVLHRCRPTLRVAHGWAPAGGGWPITARRLASLTGRISPRSVTMPVIKGAGVTSKAGLYTLTPSGAVCLPKPCVTSCAGRCSIGMPSPEGRLRSNVLDGAAT